MFFIRIVICIRAHDVLCRSTVRYTYTYIYVYDDRLVLFDVVFVRLSLIFSNDNDIHKIPTDCFVLLVMGMQNRGSRWQL